MVFSTKIATTFVDAGDEAVADIIEPTTLGGLYISVSSANTAARRRFKEVLPGIINVRTDGHHIHAAGRVRASYQ